MLDIPDAIALSAALLSFGGVGITAIVKFKPTQSSNGNGKSVTESICKERHGNLKSDIAELKIDMKEGFRELKEAIAKRT